MFRISYTSPCPVQGHIKFKKDPCYFGLGLYEDVEGRKWDIHAIYGKAFVCAIGYNNNLPYFSTTPEIRSFSIRWLPFTYEVVKEKEVG